jgi:hypothetical protein
MIHGVWILTYAIMTASTPTVASTNSVYAYDNEEVCNNAKEQIIQDLPPNLIFTGVCEPRDITDYPS